MSKARCFRPLWRISMTKKNALMRSCLLVCLLALTACSDLKIEEAKPYVTEQRQKIRQKSETIHGNNKGIVLYSNRKNADGAATGGQTNSGTQAATGTTSGGAPAVANAFLWQASLESLDFMPIAQTDSGGGVIISDWYAPPETPDERFKVTVYILDQNLRADAVKVSVFRQVDSDKGWVDAEVDKSTAIGLEDNILKRARELRLASTGES